MTTKTNNNNALTNKVLASVKKDINAYRDSFKNACVMMLEVANSTSAAAKDCKRVCSYIGLTSDSLKKNNISDFRKATLEKLPMYYIIEGTDTHFPARLQKINKNANIDGYIAVEDTYINALLSLAKILSEGNSYDMHRVEITFAEVDDEKKEYTDKTVTFTAYDRTKKKIDVEKKVYVDYLNRNRNANQAATKAKEEFWK